jgi:GNAT superfamily N-acetyltransferase
VVFCNALLLFVSTFRRTISAYDTLFVRAGQARPSCGGRLVITVTPVRDRAGRRQFVDVPYALYRGHPHWVPPLRVMEHARFKPGHPFFEHADMALFVASNGGRPLGRIAAMDDRLHNEAHQDNLASFGHFEAESEGVAHALLAAAEAWARGRGRTRIRGPLNSSLNEAAGLLVDAFDADPMLMMPYNPPEYAGFLERGGYVKAKDLLAWIIELPGAVQNARVSRVVERFRARHGLTIRSVDVSAFEAEIERFVDVYCRAWSGNWGFVKPTPAEVRQLAFELRHIIDMDLVTAAEVDGRLVGCAIALPDLNQVFKGTGGRLFPTGLLKLLARKRIVTQARLLLFGVVPEWRGTGLAAPLVVELLTRAARRYARAELSWVLEDNELTNGSVAALGGRRYKTYRVYEKTL